MEADRLVGHGSVHGERLVPGPDIRPGAGHLPIRLDRAVLRRGWLVASSGQQDFRPVLPRLGARAHGPDQARRSESTRGSPPIPSGGGTLLAGKTGAGECGVIWRFRRLRSLAIDPWLFSRPGRFDTGSPRQLFDRYAV